MGREYVNAVEQTLMSAGVLTMDQLDGNLVAADGGVLVLVLIVAGEAEIAAGMTPGAVADCRAAVTRWAAGYLSRRVAGGTHESDVQAILRSGSLTACRVDMAADLGGGRIMHSRAIGGTVPLDLGALL